MTTTSPNLGLKLYNPVVDSASLVYNWMSDVSGSSPSNMTKIDTYVGNTSSSVTQISASLINIISASLITISSASPLSNEKVLSSGSGTTIVINSNASTVRTDLTFASAAQTSSGSSATAVISASGLAQSNYGVKTVCIPLVTGTTTLAGGETQYVRIPQYMNGWKVVDAAASCGSPNGSGSSTSGSPSFTLKRSSASSMTQVSLITNVITIDASEFDSSTSASPVVIGANNTVFTGDKVWAATSASGTGVLNAAVSPTFRNMP